jgi:hypothetical protein
MSSPKKPFSGYQWHWLHYQPSEGLLKAPVYLGVLRTLQKFEGEQYSSSGLKDALEVVQADTHSSVKLARQNTSRNLFRNSGQYWRGTGLLENQRGVIKLTQLGHSVAKGEITQDEFTALMVTNTVLPNPLTYKSEEVKEWRKAGLRIKPFELIISIMSKMGTLHGATNAYLRPVELIELVIPLAGVKTKVEEICDHLDQYRRGLLDVSGWPNCAPGANDRRLAREFLLFMANFGLCSIEEGSDIYDSRFVLEEYVQAESDILLTPTSFFEDSTLVDRAVIDSASSSVPVIIERQRVTTRVLARRGQNRFRREVLSTARGRCLLSGESTPEVLEAAHIIPVGHGGSDLVGNGLCLRMDIHRLFDSGKIRLSITGGVELNESIKGSVSYKDLPSTVEYPPSVDSVNISWRDSYL